jgi:hypothetical protein
MTVSELIEELRAMPRRKNYRMSGSFKSIANAITLPG